MEEKTGLHQKYNVTKANGTPTDPDAVYFVLRLDTDQHARVAAIEYAESLFYNSDAGSAEDRLAGELVRLVQRFDPELECPICYNHGSIDDHNSDGDVDCPLCCQR